MDNGATTTGKTSRIILENNFLIDIDLGNVGLFLQI